MDDYVIELERDDDTDELQHWGIKGQKWGQRRYQNKDGSLTPAGQKRYNKEVEKLKKEKAKVKAEEKVLANKKKTQAKIDKLEADKKALEDRKKALKDGQDVGKKSKDKKNSTPEESFESRREKALKTSDPNELYKNRDTLSDMELRDRINRINMERQLAQTAASTQKTGMDRINKALEYARKADEIYKFATGSQAGKDLMKKLGLNIKKTEEFDAEDFIKNINKKTNQEVADFKNRMVNEKMGRDKWADVKKMREEAAQAEAQAKKDAEDAKKTAKYKKQVDAYNERWQKDGADDSVRSMGDPDHVDKSNSSTQTKFKGLGGPTTKTETWEGTVEGEGTSHRTNYSQTTRQKSPDYYDPIDLDSSQWRDVSSSTVSNVPATVTRRGETVIYGLLEDKYGRR